MLIKESYFPCTHLLKSAFIAHASCSKALRNVHVLRLATGNDQIIFIELFPSSHIVLIRCWVRVEWVS